MKKSLKKLVILILVLSVCSSFFAISSSAESRTIAYGAATVDASALNLRTGQGTSYSRIALIPRNAIVVILERSSADWYKVNYEGKIGYVSTDYLKDILTAENFRATGTIIATDVRMRSLPSTNGNILGVYDYDTDMTVIGINKGWYKVQYKGLTGYVRSDLMKVTGPAPASSSSSTSVSSSSGSTIGSEIAAYALQFKGYPYVYGEESPARGFDCSGLVYYVFGQFGYSMSRTASQQYKNNGTRVNKADLEPGDLVFFSSDGNGVTHVGIYIGNNEFVHASTSKTGVIISDLGSSYYTRVWYGAKRVA